MLYRALFGVIPMLLIAMVATGAVPLSTFMPSSGGYVSRAQDGKEEPGRPYRARTPEGAVSQRLGFLPPEHIEMMEDNMRASEEMIEEAERERDDRRRGLDRTKWEPRRAGWGRSGER